MAYSERERKMKAEDISDAIGMIEDEYIERALTKRTNMSNGYLRLILILAGCFLISLIGIQMLPRSGSSQPYDINNPEDLPVLNINPDKYYETMASGTVQYREGYSYPQSPDFGEFTELPVYRNAYYAGNAYMINGMSEEEIRISMDKAAEVLGVQIDIFDIYKNGKSPFNADPESIISVHGRTTDNTWLISENGYGQIRIQNNDMESQDWYEEQDSIRDDQVIQTNIEEIMNQYPELLRINNPSYVYWYTYTNTGIYYRPYTYVYEKGETPQESLFNYTFKRYEYTNDATGNITGFLYNTNTDYLETIGTFPLISYEEAYTKFMNGDYYSSCQAEHTEQIVAWELTYRSVSASEILLPWYQFIAPIENADSENGYIQCGVYYVPAVDPSYLSIEASASDGK